MLKKILLIPILLIILNQLFANKIIVENIQQLTQANNTAKPGDTILLKKGTWKNCILNLSCNGTESKPIVFKPEKGSEVVLSGESNLRISGSYLIIEGLNFTNGYSPDGSVWEFRHGDTVANHCRITNCAINSFNCLKRMKEAYWVSFYGKRNRMDHCTFYNKTNLGVLVAVILDDERSRENYHSIDSNYFAKRIPLASNTGEIIRVGVSQHCTFNSFTTISNNLFEKCDGEVEIISIKSCGNILKNNVFKECQGGLSLRHGNNNTVVGNIFLGNDKDGTGGARIINEGNWVINNLFYHCRGINFRSPLAIMNGVPNSPAYRYLPVRDAVVANNTFINCTPFSLCEGSDQERSKQPVNVYLFKNVFINDEDSILYAVFDKTDSIYFWNNLVSNRLKQPLMKGFQKKKLSIHSYETLPPLLDNQKSLLPDSISKQVIVRTKEGFPTSAGFTDWKAFKKAQANPYLGMGAFWFKIVELKLNKTNNDTPIKCKTSDEIYEAMQTNKPSIDIELTGNAYSFSRPIIISKATFSLHSATNSQILFKTTNHLSALFIVSEGSVAHFENLILNADGCNVESFMSADTSGSVNHTNFLLNHFTIANLNATNLLYAPKYSISDSIVVSNCEFSNNNCNLFSLKDESDNIGLYNVEKLRILNCTFKNNVGKILDLYRGGKDESTMGPDVAFTGNKIINCNNQNELLRLYGVQISSIKKNSFTFSNEGKLAIAYTDIVRAAHLLEKNQFVKSGTIKKNKFVTEK